jgi:transposase-like protein
MPAQRMTREIVEAALAAVAKHGTVSKAARALGVARQTLQNQVHSADRFNVPAPPRAEPTPEERRDAEFWKRRFTEASKELAETRHTLKAVAGLAGERVSFPDWALPPKGKVQNAVGLLQLSDLHGGEVVRPEEINGYNSYDIATFRRRIRRCVAGAIELLPRWAADCRLQGVVVAVNGDLVSGDIHEELARTNELTSIEQVMVVAEEVGGAILKLRDAFGVVHAVFTPGNHGRTTHKTHAKRTAALNYDTLIGKMLKDRLAGEPGITIEVSPGRDAVYPILGWTVFQSHGDALGTGGGKGFAGPMLPIVRGARAVEHQAALARQHYDIILTAHYHTSGNPGLGRLANGSMVGYSEFAHSIRASVEPPKQWLALVTERWGLRERVDLMLEDPLRPEKPRRRVPAGSGA